MSENQTCRIIMFTLKTTHVVSQLFHKLVQKKKGKCGLRVFSNISARLPTEVEIPVPWGKISARHWNPDNSKPPVLCVHGWKDNSASFNRLIPMLLTELDCQFLCIDLPGHGLSSHYPPGLHYKFSDSFIWFLRTINHFGWKKVDLFGHSLGAILGFLFASTHPLRIGKLVTIDALTPPVFSIDEMMHMIPDITDHMLRMDEKLKGPPPTYTFEEISQIMAKSHMMGIHDAGCKILMTRGIQEHPEGSNRFRFSHDIRVQYLPIMPFSHRQIANLAKHFKKGVLQIKAEDGVNYSSTYMKANIQHWLEKDNKEPVLFHEIPSSTHHLHLTHPELIVDLIVEFMKM